MSNGIEKNIGKPLSSTHKASAGIKNLQHITSCAEPYLKASPFLKKNADKALNIDQFKIPHHQLSQQEMFELQMRFNNVAVNGVMAGETGIGVYQLLQSNKNPIDLIAKNLGETPNKLIAKIGDSSALQSTYHHATKMFGIATICAGVASLVRLGTAVFDTVTDIQRQKLHKENNQKRYNILKDLVHSTEDQASSPEKLTDHKNKCMAGFKELDLSDQTAKNQVTKNRKITTDINVGSTVISSAGSLITAKCMADTIRNGAAIKQAVCALTNGAVTSAHAVLAIKVGMGLLATGITISALVSIAGVVDHFINRVRNNKNPKKLDIKQQNNKFIRMNAISGTSQLMTGIGDMMLIKNNPGFATNALLNWGEFFMKWKTGFQLDKLMTWASAGFMICGGIGSLAGAGYKMAQNHKLDQLSSEEKEKMNQKIQNDQQKLLINNAMFSTASQMLV